MSELDGEWYIMATTEPTIPAFAKQCGWLNFSVWADSYRYVSTLTVDGKNVRVLITC